ncbi:MAG: hypothetical protein V4555_05320 [Acidobacteriota bacterium]
MNHEVFIGVTDAITNAMLRTGATPESLELAAAELDAIDISDDEFIDHVLRRFDDGVSNTKHFSRLENAKQLYDSNVELLRGAAFDHYPAAHPSDVDGLLSRLHEHLDAYRGAQDESAFLGWAIRFVRREADTLRRFHQIITASRPMVLKAIWDVLKTSIDFIDDDSADDIESAVWEWLWADPKSPLYTEGSASPSTRTYGRARWIARAWKTTKLREHARLKPMDAFRERPFITGAKKQVAE